MNKKDRARKKYRKLRYNIKMINSFESIINNKHSKNSSIFALLTHRFLNECWLFNQANREKAIENWLCKTHNHSSLTNLMSTLNDHSFKNNHLLTNKTIGDWMSSIRKVYILLKAFKYQESRKVHQSDGIVNYLPCFWSWL